MKIGYLFLVNQHNGGVYQYSLSLLKSLTLNKSVSEITVYTRDKSFYFPGVKTKIINSYDFLFFISLFLSVFQIFPKILFKKNLLVQAVIVNKIFLLNFLSYYKKHIFNLSFPSFYG